MAYTVEQLKTALSRAQTPEDKAHIQGLLQKAEAPAAVERNLPGKAESFARGMASGATFDFIDEIIGGAQLFVRGGAAQDMSGKPIADNDKAPSQIYTDARDAVRADNKAAEVAHPYAYLGGQITGGAAVPGLGTAGVARSGVTQALGATGRMAVAGAGAGALFGAGHSESENAGGIAVDTAKGAGIGAIGGVVGAGVSKLLAAGGQAASNLVRNIFASTPKNVAERVIGQQLKAMGYETVEAVEAELARLGPNAKLIDLIPDLGEEIAQSGRPAAHVVSSALYERNKGMNTRIADAAEGALKPAVTGGYYKLLEGLSKIKQKIAGPMYERAMNTKLDPTDYMRTFETAAAGTPKAAYWQEALDRVATKRAAGDKISHANVFHELQKVIRGKAEAAYRNGDNDAGRALGMMRNQLVRELDDLLPDYKNARKIYGGAFRSEEAADFGRDIISKSKIMGDDFAQLTKGYSESEREALRVGLMRGVLDVVEGARDTADVTMRLTQTPRIRSILRQAFRSPEDAEKFLNAAGIEQELRRTLTQVTGNSRTAARLAMRESMKGGSEFASQIGSSPMGVVVNAVQSSLQKMSSNLSDDELKAAAELIVKQMPKQTLTRVFGRAARNVLVEMPGDSALSGATTGAALPPATRMFTEQK